MLTDQHIPILSPLKKDYDVLKMGRSRRRVGVVSAPEVAPRETPGLRQETPRKRQEIVNEEFAGFIADLESIIDIF